MSRWLPPVVFALGLLFAAPPAFAQAQARAYAPENLRTLSVADQTRVIRLEYAEQSGGRTIPADQLRFYLDQVNRSNWGFSRIKADIAQSLGGNGGPRPPVGGQTIVCESKGNDARRCTPPWRGPSRLVRQLSNSPCVENSTWNSQDRLITVWKGCRGEFAPGTNAQTIRCESKGNDARRCTPPWRGPSRLVQQLSSSPCVEGRTWNSQDGLITVWNGCRAEFAARGLGGGNSGNYSVTCGSVGNRYTTCAWNGRYGRPALIQQLSNATCREGISWGYSGNQIWVNNGCRARFGVR
ncbi:MAG TPA: DUF3011 domain-containing protein [Pseudoxanthomonas sp.]|nr:DUF3011 domain-containing protein [Pseudoxanthomonas sp.]